MGSWFVTATCNNELLWIPRLRQLVNGIGQKCHGCKRFRAIAFSKPLPGAYSLLPELMEAGHFKLSLSIMQVLYITSQERIRSQNCMYY